MSLSSINRTINGGLLSAVIEIRDRQYSEIPIIHS